MSLESGHILDEKYRIVRVLGKGGMGMVYEGENARIHRRVAIKVLHAQVASQAEIVQRFEREAQAAGRIGSEHIVEVLDLGHLPSGERYMVMEYLEGESLGDRLKKRRRFSAQAIAPIAHQLLAGLVGAHEAAIIHRDLKPDNVFLLNSRSGQRDFVKVLDFGVSKFSALDGELGATHGTSVLGTPFYMSPEQAKGGGVDARSDLYAVGVILYQCVTGRLPHQADTFNELIFKIALEPPEPAELAAPGLDLGFAAILKKAMAREPAERFQSAREFQQALGNWMMTSALAPGADLGASPTGLLGQTGDEALLTPGYPSPTTFSGNELSGSLSGSPRELTATPLPRAPRGRGSLAALGLVGAALFSGGVFAAYRLTRPQPPPAAAVSANTAPTASAPVDAAPAPTPSATTTTETKTAAAETAAATAEPASATTAPPVAPASPDKSKPTTSTPPRPAAIPAPAGTTKAAQPPKPTGGRVIGNEL